MDGQMGYLNTESPTENGMKEVKRWETSPEKYMKWEKTTTR